MPGPKKVLIALPLAMLAEADYVAEQEHRTRSDLIREALRRYIAFFKRDHSKPATSIDTGAPEVYAQYIDPLEVLTMRIFILSAILLACVVSQLPVSAYYGNNYGNQPTYGRGGAYWNAGSSQYGTGGYNSIPAPVTGTTTYTPLMGTSRTQYSNGATSTTTYTPLMNSSRTTYSY